MSILGIDYGKRKIGLAISTEGKLATPLKVLRVTSNDDALEKIGSVLEEEGVGEVVIGISEGKIAKEIEGFAELLQGKSGVKVIFQDETLTTKDAQEMSIDAGIKRKKRKEMEDAYSATLILQDYLDSL
jgi:putative Holliday junction resolvase